MPLWLLWLLWPLRPLRLHLLNGPSLDLGSDQPNRCIY